MSQAMIAEGKNGTHTSNEVESIALYLTVFASKINAMDST
jgi:hypothetical protein